MIEKDSGKQMINVLGGQLRIEQNNNRLVVSKGTVDVLLLGVDDDGNVVIKLAQDGVDVKAATSDELIMSSQFNMFKIVQTDTFTHSFSGGETAVSIPHNLGFQPAYVAYAIPPTFFPEIIPSHWQNLPIISVLRNLIDDSLNDISTVSSHITDTNIVFSVDHMASAWPSAGWQFRYYLMVETVD